MRMFLGLPNWRAAPGLVFRKLIAHKSKCLSNHSRTALKFKSGQLVVEREALATESEKRCQELASEGN